MGHRQKEEVFEEVDRRKTYLYHKIWQESAENFLSTITREKERLNSEADE